MVMGFLKENPAVVVVLVMITIMTIAAYDLGKRVLEWRESATACSSSNSSMI